MLTDWGVPGTLAILGVALLAWNLAVGARATTITSAGRAFRVLSGLGAFLLLPALVIGLLAPTAVGARILGPLDWLWPLVVVGFAAQALWAAAGGRAAAAVAVPIALYDVLAAWVAVTRWLESQGSLLPAWMLAPGMAGSSIGASALGDDAFLWTAALLFPLLVPAAPARWPLSGAWRAFVATGCLTLVVLVGADVPGAYGALAAERALGAGTMQERTPRDFAVGLRLFGTLGGAPAGSVARHDVALADSLGVTALHIALQPEAVTASALDSMARSIEGRRDSVVLVVTLAMARGDGQAPGAGEGWLRARLALVEQVVRRLHPDVLLPAEDMGPAPGLADVRWWQSYYGRVARTARRADGDVAIALATDAGTGADSALCDWVMAGGSPVGAIALSVRGHAGTPARFERALAAMARWVSLGRAVPPVWLVTVPTSPGVTGEVAQQHLVRRALQWGAARAWVRGVIAGDASDVLSSTGLRTATGRSLAALAEVGAALRALREAPVTAPAVPAASSSDSLRVRPDSPNPIRP